MNGRDTNAGCRGGQEQARGYPLLLLRHGVRAVIGARREAHVLSSGTPRSALSLSILGAEAVENAVKIARYYTGRPAVIAREPLPWLHDVRDDAHGQDRPAQEGLRAVRPRGLQGAFTLRLPLPCGQGLLGRLPGRLLRGHREGVREHGSPEQRSGDHRRAGQWGGRLPPFPTST